MERAGRLIPKLKLSPELSDPETRAKAAWALAAGPNIARHTKAVALVRDKLVIEVEDMLWQRQVAPYEAVLLRNLRQSLGESIVASLDFRPMPRAERLKPQTAVTSRPQGDLTERIEDPVLAWNYRQSKNKR